jgi:hypothetical protein
MSSNVTVPLSDSGSPTGLPGDRVMRGTIARWASSTGWVDRDGLPIPETMLVIGYITVLRRWKDKRPEYKTEHPLPDPDVLNAAIPIAEWEIGLDGKPRRPWALTYVIYLVDLKTGALYTYAADTYGAMQAYNALEEQIAVMRMLRGEHVFPIVRLEKRPWKSQTYGMQMRPHFQVVDWRASGGTPVVSPTPTPQLTGPLAATPSAASAPATPASAPTTSSSAPVTPPQSPILDAMRPVKPVTVAEAIADELPPWA